MDPVILFLKKIDLSLCFPMVYDIQWYITSNGIWLAYTWKCGIDII